ncbi:MAG TPA: peptidylprolyl isomerase [Symbiobacteriaceae bacterium]
MKRVIGAVLLSAILIGAGLAGCSKLSMSGSDRLAVVEGHALTKEDLDVRLKLYELFFKQSMDNPNSRNQLLEQMVRERLMKAQAGKLGVAISDAQVEAESAKFYGALDKQYKSRDEVNQEFLKLGLTNDQLAAFMKDYLVGQNVLEKKRAEIAVTEDEVRAYYDQNKDTVYNFKEPVVRAAHILVPLDQEARAQEVVAKAKAGGNFAELANLYSVDPGSARLGGDLGYFTRGSMVKELADVAFTLAPGEIGAPVKSQFGWHVVRVVDKQGPGVLPFEKAREDIVNRLLPDKQEKATQQWLDDLERTARIERSAAAGKNE